MVKIKVGSYRRKIKRKRRFVSGYYRRKRPKGKRIVKVTRKRLIQEIGRDKYGQIKFVRFKKIRK